MQPTLRDFAQKLNDHPALRQVFFLTAALASIALVGYHFGALDQAVHIPFLRATADPDLYPGDPFLALRKDQYSIFWYFFIPFLRSGLLEQAMFLVHLLVIFLFFTAIWELCITIFSDPMAALIASLAFIIPHTGFVGFPVIEYTLQSRTFVLPFLLFAVNLFLNHRRGKAFLILGLMYNVNLLMTNFVLAGLLFYSLLEIRKGSLNKFGLNVGSFLFGALPVLLWKIHSGDGLDFSLRPDWFSAISNGGLFQINYIFSATAFMLLTMGGLSCIIMFFVARKNCPSGVHDREIVFFMIAMICILAFQVITTFWIPITFIIQLQISRASIFILIFAYIYFANYLAKIFVSKKISDGTLILVAGSFIFSVSPLIPLLILISTRIRPELFGMNKTAAAIGLLLLVTGYMSAGISLKLWQPSINIFGKPSPWVDVQNWARENTSTNALFITPPQEVGLYQPDWRVFSERGTVASLYDIFEVALKPDHLGTWKVRFENLAPKALDQFRGNYFENQTITRGAYNQLRTDQIIKIAERYSASYLVMEKSISHNLPILYENELYKVFGLKK